LEERAQKVARLIAATWGEDVSLAELIPLAGDASSRHYDRAVLLSPLGLPASMIVMSIPDRGLALSSEELSIFRGPLRELPFVNTQRFFSSIGLLVPKVYANHSSEGLLFLQDLGDTLLWDCVVGKGHEEVLDWYHKAMDQLLIIHVLGTAERDPDCYAFQQEFDERLYLWEFEHFVEHGLVEGLGMPLSPRMRQILEKHFASMASELNGAPKVLSHRDFHSWNLLVHEEKVWVIDFQDALLAPAQYDLASLLNDRESPKVVTPEIEAELMDHYLRRRSEMGEPVRNLKSFRRIYLLSAFQRDLKVIGRFHFLERVQGKKGYLGFLSTVIPRALRRLRDLEDHRPLLEVLDHPLRELLTKIPPPIMP
jgi:hypothetical protein